MRNRFPEGFVLRDAYGFQVLGQGHEQGVITRDFVFHGKIQGMARLNRLFPQVGQMKGSFPNGFGLFESEALVMGIVDQNVQKLDAPKGGRDPIPVAAQQAPGLLGLIAPDQKVSENVRVNDDHAIPWRFHLWMSLSVSGFLPS